MRWRGPWERKFLGFSFTSAGITKRRIAPKAVDRFKERMRELTCRTRGVSIERITHELAAYIRGWIGYFGKMRNAFRVARSPGVDQTQAAVCGLEAVETRIGAVCRIEEAGRG